jgi:hypothetical protein
MFYIEKKYAYPARRCRRGWATAVTMAALVAACTVHAASHSFPCATTAQQLQDDLTAASDGGMYNGDDNTIYVGKGAFKTGAATGNGPFHYNSTAASGALYINGGYGLNCSTAVSDNSFAVLDGNNATQVLKINNKNASVFLKLLTIP